MKYAEYMIGSAGLKWVTCSVKWVNEHLHHNHSLLSTYDHERAKYHFRVSTELKLKFQPKFQKKVIFFQPFGQKKQIVFQPYHEF